MKSLKMTHNHDSIVTAIASVAAYVLADIAQLMADESFLKGVSALSAVILMFTALIKFAHLCIESWNKLARWYRQRKAPPTP
jgi:hypothetical protein